MTVQRHNFKSLALSCAIILLTLWITLPAMARSPSPEMGPPTLYFLAVGMGQSSFMTPFEDAGKSADVVARSLLEAGAHYGIVLASGSDRPGRVSRDDVLDALERLKARIRADDPVAPRIVVYVMGHGLADRTAGYEFILPDTLDLAETGVTQNTVFRLARRSVFSIDLLASLMSFRLDDRMAHLDAKVFSEDRFSDLPFGGGFLIDMSRRYAREQRYLDQKAQSYGTAPFANAPIPFLLLIDNCNTGIRETVAPPNPMLNQLAQSMRDMTLDQGRAFYAVPPGADASPRILPERLTDDDEIIVSNGRAATPVIGPLAIHLRHLVRNTRRAEAMSLEDLAAALASSGLSESADLPPPPHEVPGKLRPDVAKFTFFPAPASPMGEITVLHGTGQGTVRCCERID